MRSLLLYLLLGLAACDIEIPTEPETSSASTEVVSLDYRVAEYIPVGVYVSYVDIKIYVGRIVPADMLNAALWHLQELGLQKVLPATNEVWYRWPTQKHKTRALSILGEN